MNTIVNSAVLVASKLWPSGGHMQWRGIISFTFVNLAYKRWLHGEVKWPSKYSVPTTKYLPSQSANVALRRPQ